MRETRSASEATSALCAALQTLAGELEAMARSSESDGVRSAKASVVRRLGDLQVALAKTPTGSLPIELPSPSPDPSPETKPSVAAASLSVFGRWVYSLREPISADDEESTEYRDGLVSYLETVLCETGWHPLAADLDGATPLWGDVRFHAGGSARPPRVAQDAFSLPDDTPILDYARRA